MTTLAFDGRMGASGDMLLGALLAAGADAAVLEPVESALAVRYDIGMTTHCGIEAVDVSVRHQADGDHVGQNASETTENHGPHRTLGEVVEIVESMDLFPAVTAEATAIFELLGEAEATVHGTDVEETHFHEVGADDAIADVVGTALLLDDIEYDHAVTTPLAAGEGTVETSHGVYPVPTPAVIELAEQARWSVRGGPVDRELLTPTGAAILAHIADGVARLPELQVQASGYGAGDANIPDRPNVLRALVGTQRASLSREEITVLETHLDDATPETLGGLHESLSEVGALDVAVVPLTMKKSRPGHLIKVVVAPEDADRVARRLAAETGTLGVREHGSGHRFVADRTVQSVSVEVGGEPRSIDVKVARLDETVYDVSAEYDDARAVADESDRTVREVCWRAERAARAQLGVDPE